MTLRIVLAMALAVGSWQGDRPSPDRGEAGSDPDRAADFSADPARWDWISRTLAPGETCELSSIADAVQRAAAGARVDTDLTVNHGIDYQTTTRNAAGPSFNDGIEIFPALAALVARAEYEVDLTVHQVDVEEAPFQVFLDGVDALQRRLAQEGRRGDPVVIRIILNVRRILNGRWSGAGRVEAVYREIVRRQIDPELVVFELGTDTHIVYSVNHIKMAVVDGVYVHIGGANPTYRNAWVDRNEDAFGPIWEHDAAFVLRGQVAQAALAAFDRSWNDDTDVYQCEMMQDVADCEGVDEDSLGYRPIQHRTEVFQPDLEAHGIATTACLPMITMAKRSTENVLCSVFGILDTDNNPVARGLEAAIRNARFSAKLSTPNLNAGIITDSIVAAVRENRVAVSLLIGSIDYNQSAESFPCAGGANVRNVNRLFERACVGEDTCALDARIYWRKSFSCRYFGEESRECRYANAGCPACWIRAEAVTHAQLGPPPELTPGTSDSEFADRIARYEAEFVDLYYQTVADCREEFGGACIAHRGGGAAGGRHTKYYSFDDQLAFVGTVNLDVAGMKRLRDIEIAIDDPSVSAAYDRAVFDYDWERAAPWR